MAFKNKVGVLGNFTVMSAADVLDRSTTEEAPRRQCWQTQVPLLANSRMSVAAMYKQGHEWLVRNPGLMK